MKKASRAEPKVPKESRRVSFSSRCIDFRNNFEIPSSKFIKRPLIRDSARRGQGFGLAGLEYPSNKYVIVFIVIYLDPSASIHKAIRSRASSENSESSSSLRRSKSMNAYSLCMAVERR